jgi:hypothetical protein
VEGNPSTCSITPVALLCNSWRHRDLLRTPLPYSSEARFLVFWQVHQHSYLPTICIEQLPQLSTDTFAATLNVKEGRTFEQSRVTEQEWLHTCFVNVQCLLDSHRNNTHLTANSFTSPQARKFDLEHPYSLAIYNPLIPVNLEHRHAHATTTCASLRSSYGKLTV